MKLVPGLYEQLVTDNLDTLLAAVSGAERAPLGQSEASRVLARHLADFVARALETIPDKERPGAQIDIVNRLVATLRESLDGFVSPDDRVRAEVLRAIAPHGRTAERPELPLSESGLYVNARRERRIGAALNREIASADRVDLICAFLVWGGYLELRQALVEHMSRGRPLRVLTTTYRGVTQARVLEDLIAMGAQVRVSYRSDVTRLHAKAWLFHRDSGFSTTYIGSSNLSRSAMVAGLEWNVRLSEVENRGVWGEVRGAFDGYWLDPEFEPYDADRFAIEVRSERPDRTVHAVFELRPRPFQQDILDKLDAERTLHDRHRNLVVAATGTGKTVIAALDYRRLCQQTNRRPSLLFVAHRREILRQSLDMYRHAMSDPNFGERLVEGQRPSDWHHVFASVQSLAEHDVESWAPDRFDVVVVDEFHHATETNDTYAKLLRHLKPRELLGLTATPERADGIDILSWFEGRIAAEVRLWDAIDRGLLVPFHYFASHDVASTKGIRWASRRRLDPKALDGLYTGHHARAHLIVEAVRRHIYDPLAMRALAFCAGVGHAEFMATAFEKAGIPSVFVTGNTRKAERDRALSDLRDGKVRCIFAVDVFNEGVDIPEIDTVLFLRPTESATVFLQQLGRGLRRAPGKRALTVLDFVAEADRKFRFDVRYRPLVEPGTGRQGIKRQVEEGFPFLPSGCSITLDRTSREIVLDGVCQAIGTNRRSLVAELRHLGDVSLATFLRETDLEPEELYRNGLSFSELKRAARLPCPPEGKQEEKLARGLGRILHVDDRIRLDRWRDLLRQGVPGQPRDPVDQRLWLMLTTMLLGREADHSEIASLWQHPAVRAELGELLDILDARLDHTVVPFHRRGDVPLALHARYRLSEIMAAFGDVRDGALYMPREGEQFDEATRCNLLLVTLEKDEKDYSATTMYNDYAIGPTRFHWQTQSGTRPTDKKGRRHIEHVEQDVLPLLFIRQRKKDDYRRTMPYAFLGPANIATWTGERPMNIEWELEVPMPATWLRASGVVG